MVASWPDYGASIHGRVSSVPQRIAVMRQTTWATSGGGVDGVRPFCPLRAAICCHRPAGSFRNVSQARLHHSLTDRPTSTFRSPPETYRNQSNKTTNDRVKSGTTGDSLLLNQENRRPPLDRNGTRGTASRPLSPSPFRTSPTKS